MASYATIPVGEQPSWVAATPDGAHLYVTNYSSNSVSVIETSSRTVIRNPITFGNYPAGVAVASGRAYVANSLSDTVSVISTTTNAVVATIPVEPEPMGVAVTPNGARVYITHPYLDKLSLIITTTNPANNTVKTIDIPPPSAGWVVPVSGPSSVAIAPGGSRAYVTNKFSDSVTVIDTASNISGPMAVLIPGIMVGSQPWGVAVARMAMSTWRIPARTLCQLLTQGTT